MHHRRRRRRLSFVATAAGATADGASGKGARCLQAHRCWRLYRC